MNINYVNFPTAAAFDIAALPALPTAIQDTDLFAANRSGTHYKTTGAALEIYLGGNTGGGGTEPVSNAVATPESDEEILLTWTNP